MTWRDESHPEKPPVTMSERTRVHLGFSREYMLAQGYKLDWDRDIWRTGGSDVVEG